MPPDETGKEPAKVPLEEMPTGPTIVVRPNGPYRVFGPVKLLDDDGNEFEIPEGRWYVLCRCGLSETKPFCDSTHKRAGFAPETRAVPPSA